MKQFIKISDLFFPLLLAIVLMLSIFVALSGCSNDLSDEAAATDEAVINLLLGTSASGINVDKELWEDRVEEVRMLAFGTTGEVVYNDILSFPAGFGASSAAIRFKPGVYDFYFIANEKSASADFVAALTTLRNRTELTADARFSALSYQTAFMPDGTTPDGMFLMSARYDDVPVHSGGTETHPLPLPLPTDKVQLIRSLAKVQVVFRKKVSGSAVPEGFIQSLQLQNVAQTYSVPAIDAYYAGSTTGSQQIQPVGFDYQADSIGSVTWYIPELLNPVDGVNYTTLHINDRTFPLETDDDLNGLDEQRRQLDNLSNYCVIRNYHYLIDAYIDGEAEGGIELQACVMPWHPEAYKYMFQNEDQVIVAPPVIPTDSTLIIATECGKIEMMAVNEVLQQGLQGAYGDQIVWWDPVLQGPTVKPGEAPYYCEKKYGKGWRLVNSCELMSFLKLFDQTYRIWQSNTWQGINSGLTYYSLPMRQEAQELLGKITGYDMSAFVPTDNGIDDFGSEKLNILDRFFTPGDIRVSESDYPAGSWPYYGKPNNSGQSWYPMEVSIQVKGYWYAGYLDFNVDENYDKILYGEFYRFDYSSTMSRCVREVE
ncbi:MAG: FimB/Mfa2 family fimbrial subunit [Prevotellaceae bacterium]|jgi:hypothetical protein|nr:FimB/Mfa2 family fimbrial subunit [Prevotellaceae bacterium]